MCVHYMECDCDGKCLFSPQDNNKDLRKEQKKILITMRNNVIDAIAQSLSNINRNNDLRNAIKDRKKPVEEVDDEI